MNSHQLKITRNCELPEPLEIGQEYKVTVLGEVTGISKDDNDDGSFNFTYKMQLRSAEVVTPLGKVLKTKDNKKQSVKLRGQILALGLDYDTTMVDLRHWLPEIIDYIKYIEQGIDKGIKS